MEPAMQVGISADAAGHSPSASNEAYQEAKKSYVVGFLFDRDLEHVVLIKKRRPTWMSGLYNGIGGKIEPHDNLSALKRDTNPAYEAMVREWREETGDDQELAWKSFAKLDTRRGKIHFFAATGDVSRARTVTDEEVGVKSCLVVPYFVMPNLRWLIPMAKNFLNDQCTVRRQTVEQCDFFEIREASYRNLEVR